MSTQTVETKMNPWQELPPSQEAHATQITVEQAQQVAEPIMVHLVSEDPVPIEAALVDRFTQIQAAKQAAEPIRPSVARKIARF
jgi:hypothetical protein